MTGTGARNITGAPRPAPTRPGGGGAQAIHDRGGGPSTRRAGTRGALAPRCRPVSIAGPRRRSGELVSIDPRARYAVPIEVQDGDIDRLGHVNNVVYVRWIQDAAIAHWRALATPAQQAECAWVVVRHEIDYKRPAKPGDALVAETWVGPADRQQFERRTEILRAGDRKVIATARTLWCPVDPVTLRPKHVSAELRARFSVMPEPPFGEAGPAK